MAPESMTSNAPQPAQPPIDLSNLPNLNIDKNQILQLLQSVPGIFPRVIGEPGKEDQAAQALQNLSQNPAFAQALAGHAIPLPGYPMGEPGPSSHPRGPPNLTGLGVTAAAAAARNEEEGASDDADGVKDGSGGQNPAQQTGGRRSRSGAAMGSDEWTRQRKDNHKEVERRRRGNINEGINELGRIVPNGSGEKSKGAILSRAVQYIHHLKENEARNIEKWTLEKLLMDQAMGDLQAQLEEVRRMWEEERLGRQRAEAELEVLRGSGGGKPGGMKRGSEDVDGEEEASKRQRTD